MKNYLTILLTLILSIFFFSTIISQDTIQYEGPIKGRFIVSIKFNELLKADLKGYLYELNGKSIIISPNKIIDDIYVDHDLEIIPIEQISEINFYKKNGIISSVFGSLVGVYIGGRFFIERFLNTKDTAFDRFLSVILTPLVLGPTGAILGYKIGRSSKIYILNGSIENYTKYKYEWKKYLMKNSKQEQLEKTYKKERLRKERKERDANRTYQWF